MVFTELNWKEGDLNLVTPILCVTVFFTLYWFTAHSSAIKSWFYGKYDFDQASLRFFLFTKIFGFFSMGILSLICCLFLLKDFSISDYGLTFIGSTTLFSLQWIVGLSIVVVPLAFYSAKQPKNHVNYPQMRSKIWTPRMVILVAFGWAAYLFGYELLFRGILLFPLVEEIGVWGAIAINVALYSATHIPKGLDETIGSIPLGLVLCVLTLYSGTIWIAFFVHVIMGLTNEFTALKFNPEIQFKRG